MKKWLFLISLLAFYGLQAQTDKLVNIRQMLVSFNGANYNGLVADVAAPPDIVEDVLKDRFSKQGVKPKEINGFLVFRNVKLPSVDSVNLMDAFFKVEKKSRKEKDLSTVSLIPARHGDIPDEKIKSGVPGTVVTPAATSNGVITELTPDIEMKVYERKLSEKQEEIRKSEKAIKDLQEDQADYEKKQKKLEYDIEKNKHDLEFESGNLEKVKKENGDIKAAEKKVKNAQDDQAGNEKKLRNTLEDLEKNKKQQEFEKANLERLRKDLEDLNSKRPGNSNS